MKGVELHTYALSWSGAIRLLLETADLYRYGADEAIEQLQQPAFECLRDRFLAQMDYCEWHDRDKLAADRIACQSAKAGWLPSGVAAEPTETREWAGEIRGTKCPVPPKAHPPKEAPGALARPSLQTLNCSKPKPFDTGAGY